MNEIINKYLNDPTATKTSLAKEFGISYSKISWLFKKNNIIIDKQKYSKSITILKDSDLNNIQKLYYEDKLKIEDICKIYKVSRPTMDDFFTKHNLSTRRRKDYNKHKININYFQKIDSEDKAYFLGLMYADGNIYKRMWRIQLQIRDIDILEKLKKCIEYSGELYFTKSKKITQQDKIGLYFCSDYMCQDLIKLGCYPNKSLTLKFPTEEQVPKEFIRHFIRGYFDGDGWIHVTQTINQWGIISTEHFCSSVKQILEQIGIQFSLKSLSLHKNKTNRILRLSNAQDIKKIYAYLYKDSFIWLDRKYNKFKQFLDIQK